MTQLSVVQNDEIPASFNGLKVLLLGGPGSGKTYATAGIADIGLKVRYAMLENAKDSVAKYFSDRNKQVPPNIAWHYIPMSQISFEALGKMSAAINQLSFDTLTKMSDPDRTKYQELVQFCNLLAKYTDERTGAELGSVDSWGNDTVLVVESLSALNRAAMNLVVGGRPTRGQQDWQISQNNLEAILNRLTQVRCHVVVTAHLEREIDEVTGGSMLMPSTLGRKLAPRLGNFFTDVIHVKREGPKFVWATDTINADLKARHLPIAGNLAPSFAPLYAEWRKLALASAAGGGKVA